MKRFAISLTVAALAFSVALTVWPLATSRIFPNRAMAQEPTAPKKEVKQKESAARKLSKRVEEGMKESANPSEAIERILANPGNFEFSDVTLQDFVSALSAKFEIPIVIDKPAFDDAGIDTGKTLSTNLRGIRGDKFLDLTLDELGLSWVTRDGYLLITTNTKLLELLDIRVYNCSDLLERVKKNQPAKGGPEGMGFDSMSGMSSAMAGHPRGRMAGGMSGMAGMPGMTGMPGMSSGGAMPGMPSGMGMGMGSSGEMSVAGAESSAPPLVEDSDELIRLIQTTVAAEHWQDVGGQGSIEAYPGGLLVINQHGQAHRRIENLLNMMRQARRAAPGTVVRER